MDTETQETSIIKFRWKHIMLPAAILVISIILAAVFYGRLPETVGWTFQSDGSPDRWANRGTLVFCIIGLQVFFLLAAWGISRGITTIYNRYADSDSGPANPAVTINVMGNMLVVPQVIIFFAMIDIFSYNSYQTHFLPLWLNALIVLLAGGIILGIFFLRAGLQVWRVNKE
ncbi:MAG TPA: DUF1648 domain-containing protein [Dehalococcoidia bacterium]|nr:DUF1648 domain-containing protein [Dehalococcoidia bacterium]